MNKGALVWLQSEVAAARPEFELLIERAGAEGAAWVDHGNELLDEASAALSRGAIEAGWRHLHTAKRVEIYGLERLDQQLEADGQGPNLEIRAAVVREKALDKLDGWRRRTVVDIRCDGNEELKDGITGSELRSATRILQEHHESVYLLRSERQRQFNQLALMGALSGLFLFLLTLMDWQWDEASGLLGVVGSFLETPFPPEDVMLTAPGFAVFVTIVGVMGASLFGMRSLRKRSLATNIPQQIS